MTSIYHLTTRESWDAAQTLAEYRAESLATEGFIHASTAHQVEASANRYFSQAASIILLKIDVTQLPEPPVWEMSPHSADPFPHLYGPIPLQAVSEVLFWPKSDEGEYRLATVL